MKKIPKYYLKNECSSGILLKKKRKRRKESFALNNLEF